MLCDICHKNLATVHLTEVVDAEVKELHICQSCAAAKTEALNEGLNISGFLSGLTNSGKSERNATDFSCSFCQLTWSEFNKKGLLGCEHCYAVFRPRLLPLLKKIHGSARHIGKNPALQDKKLPVTARLGGLREQLKRAIQLEEYEEAARLRDAIRKAEKDA